MSDDKLDKKLHEELGKTAIDAQSVVENIEKTIATVSKVIRKSKADDKGLVRELVALTNSYEKMVQTFFELVREPDNNKY